MNLAPVKVEHALRPRAGMRRSHPPLLAINNFVHTGARRARRARSAVGDRGQREALAPASPSRCPGNGILLAETGGRFWAQNTRGRSESDSQTALRLANRPKLRGFLQTRKPRRFAGTFW